MKRCHKCASEWTRPEQPGFKEVCPDCQSWLHSCLNCRLYNPSSDRCSSITAECTGDRASLNYCEEFRFRDMPNNSNGRQRNGNGRRRAQDTGVQAEKSSARDKFNQLFNGNL